MAQHLRPDQVVSLRLTVGSTGPEVTLIHSLLLLIQGELDTIDDSSRQTIPSRNELATATYGPATRLAVLTFQRANAAEFGSPPTGIADIETLTVLRSKLKELQVDWNHPRTQFVAGKIQSRDSSSTDTKVLLSVFDRDLDAEEREIAATVVDVNGHFAASYPLDKVLRAGSGRHPTLLFKLSDNGENIFTSDLAEAVPNAPALAVVALDVPSTTTTIPMDEFSRTIRALRSVVPPSIADEARLDTSFSLPIRPILSSSLRDWAAELRSERPADLRLLSRLKPADLPMPTIRTTALASELSRTAGDRHNIDIGTEVFYGLLGTEAQRNLFARNPADIGLAEVASTTKPDELLMQLALNLDSDALLASLDAAVAKGLVTKNWDVGELLKNWERIKDISKGWIKQQATTEDYVWGLIAEFLSSGKEKAVRAVLQSDNIEGDILGFLQNLAVAFSTKPPTPPLGPLEPFDPHPPFDPLPPFDPPPPLGPIPPFVPPPRIPNNLPIPIRTRNDLLQSLKKTHGLRALSSLSAGALSDLVKRTTEVNGEGGATQEDARLVVADLHHEIEKSFPTAAFKMKLTEHNRVRMTTPTDRGETAARSTQTGTQTPGILGDQTLAIDSHSVLDFLETHPDFSMQSDRIKRISIANEPDKRQLEQMSKVQRVFKLAPTFEHSVALLDRGIHSASQISSMTKSRFLKQMSSDARITTADASEIFDRAAAVRLGTALLAADIRTTSNAMLLPGISSPLPPAKLEALVTDFPDIATLFQLGDICACDDCVTVHSPAAYFVDLLEFLRYRQVLDSVGGPDSGQTARDVLLGRRPDLGNIDLSCDNTKTTLPFIDLVCELLEDLVAPDGLSPASFTGALASGKISKELLQLLRDELHLPFTENATVSDVFNGSHRNVRDSAAVVMLGPLVAAGEGTSSAVRVLRQTYGSSEALAAMPAYINDVAMSRLRESVFLPMLPFDLAFQESREYLAQLGVSRVKLMKSVLGAPSESAIAFDTLSLNDIEGTLVMTPDPGNQNKYWNIADGEDPVARLMQVSAFLEASRIDYVDLQSMMNATSWLNPPAADSTNPSSSAPGKMFLKADRNTCSQADRSIQELDSEGLDRFHRFIRLWKKLAARNSEWTVADIDRIIGAARLGAGRLDASTLQTIVGIEDLTQRLDQAGSTSLDQVIDLFSVLRTRIDPPTDGTTTYGSVFLNELAHGPVDPQFAVQEVLKNESSNSVLLGDHAVYLANCLGVSVEAVGLIIATISAKAGNSRLTLTNLSAAYAMTLFARKLALDVAGMLRLAELTGLDPFTSVQQMAAFVSNVEELRALHLSVLEVLFLTSPPSATTAAIDIADARAIEILADLKEAYSVAQASNKSPFDPQLGVDANAATALALVSKIEPARAQARPITMSQTDIAAFATMLQSGLAHATAAELVGELLQPAIGAEPSAAILAAQDALSASAAEERDSKRSTLAEVVSDALSAHFSTLQRTNVLVEKLVAGFGLSSESVISLLAGIPRLDALRDARLASEASPSPILDEASRALRLVHKLALFVGKLKLEPRRLSWLLMRSSDLGWADLKALPLSNGDSAMPWPAWAATMEYLVATKDDQFPDVANPDHKVQPYTLEGYLDKAVENATAANADNSTLLPHIGALTGQDPTVISALMLSMGLQRDDFRRVTTLQRLDQAADTVRKLNMSVSAAIRLASQPFLTPADTLAVRSALKLRFPVEADWLSVLKTIQDKLRVHKRDALVAFLLATNKPRLSRPSDLSDLLLIDVETGPVSVTSRIIQAQLSIQQLVQRLTMGLEPTPIDPEDTDWTKWQFMADYPLWEASKRVFHYPENWIEPDLRADKSELYIKAEEQLQKQPLTDPNIEKVIAAYLRDLDDIAYLEVFTTFYDVPRQNLHVFARSKGGNPRAYYHRTQFAQSVWTPWTRMEGVAVPGDIVTSFLRGTRLTIAWPIFTYEPDPASVKEPAPFPDVMNLTNSDGTQKSPDPPQQRLAVQLGLIELDPSTKKWSPAVVTEGAVYWPPTGVYVSKAEFPENFERMISLHYWDLGNNLGESIVLCVNRFLERVPEQSVSAMFGAFNMTGCKGFPIPYDPGLKRSQPIPFTPRPIFRRTELQSGRQIKASNVPSNSDADLAALGILDGNTYATVLGQEKGRFLVTHPSNPSVIDRFFVGTQMWALAQNPDAVNPTFSSVPQRGAFIIPQGTFLPYFVTDSSTRTYAVTPGYASAAPGDDNFRTATATFEFFERAKNLALKYIAVYYGEANKDIAVVRTRLEADGDYKRLKEEWLNVYVDATDVHNVKLRQPSQQLTTFYHPAVCHLLSKLYSGGLDALLSREAQLFDSTLDFKATYSPTDRVRLPYPREDLDFSTNGGFSSYNYDLVFFLQWHIAKSLTADKQYEKAQRFFHYIFNPAGKDLEDPDTGPDRATAPQKRYWQTKPFYRMNVADYAEQRIDAILSTIAADPAGNSIANDVQTQIRLWRSNPFDPSTIAKARPVAYQIAIVMRYIQNLVDWGDSLFRQLTRESLNRASLMYMTADRLLGRKPRLVEPVAKPPIRSYNELKDRIDLVGNAMLDLEDLIPDLSTLPHGGLELPTTTVDGQTTPIPLTSLYFCIPPNDKMLQLWDLVADRLVKIRNSQDIDGNFISLALTAPPIDPGALIKALAAGASLSDIIGGMNAPLPHYRFQYVFEQAVAITQDVIDLGQQLFAVIEKQDAEGLARLRANSEITVLKAVRDVKDSAITQNTAATKALETSKGMALTRQIYYQNLVDGKLFKNEADSLQKNLEATGVDRDMATTHRDASWWHYFPAITVGTGAPFTVNFSASYGGANVASAKTSDTAARAAERSILATDAVNMATKASHDRRSNEWEFQKFLAIRELETIEDQILASKATGDMLRDDLTAHDSSTTESTSTRDYLQSKYSNTELYEWAKAQISKTYSDAYQLAFSMAKKAERCMAFELGDFSDNGTIIGFGSWDTLRSGLLAGNDLRLNLRRLQSTYMDRHKREFELTKSISLANIAPEALLDLRTKGTCMFSLSETLFDLDYPGHYFRRTKSISMHILTRIPPFGSVSATLRLVSSRYRSAPTGATPAAYTETPPGADPRFTYNVIASPSATASATAANDAGVFELSLRGDDPRYLPFEYAGVLGTYTLSLPPIESFAYADVADAVLHVSYTARDGGGALREAAMPVPGGGGGVASIALRSQFRAEWNALKAGRGDVEMVLVTKEQLPFWAGSQGRSVEVKETEWSVLVDEGVAVGTDERLVVAGTEMALQSTASEDDDGGGRRRWKATLPAGKVALGQSVPVAWKGAGGRGETAAAAAAFEKVREVVCVVHFDVKTPRR